MHESYHLMGDESISPPDGDVPFLDLDQAAEHAGDLSTALIIWIPAGSLAILSILFGMPVLGIVLTGCTFALHSVMRPHVSVYALLFTQPLQWAVVVLPDVASITKLVGIGALLFTLPKLFRAMSPQNWDPCVKWMLGFVTWTLLSLAWASDFTVGLLGWQSLVLVWGLALLIVLQLDTPGKLHAAMMIFVASCLLSDMALFTSGELDNVVRQSGARASVSSLVGESAKANSNQVAHLFAVAMFVAVYLMLVSKRLILRAGLAVGVVALALGLILLKSRSTWIASLCGPIAGILFLRGGGTGKRVLALLLILVLGLGTGIAGSKLGILGKGVQDRAATIFEQGVEAGGRIHFWRAHADAFVETGGIGVGYRQMALKIGHVAHNDWFSIAGDLGVVGLVLFAGLHVTLFRRMLKMNAVWPKYLCLVIWTFICTVTLAGDGFNKRRYTLSIGLIVAALRIDENTRQATLLYQDSKPRAHWHGDAAHF